MRVRQAMYLHGFASSPGSSKAARFRREFAARGVGWSCPDFNQPAFETLTVTRMLADTREAMARAGEGPMVLIGSSLGGFVAVHAAAEDRTGAVAALVLLAPGLEFGGNRLRQLGEASIDEWRRAGSLEVFHYADGRRRHVSFQLYEDAARYDAYGLSIEIPTLILQGQHDTVVDPESVRTWAAGRANVELQMLDDGHELTASMDEIWRRTEAFLG